MRSVSRAPKRKYPRLVVLGPIVAFVVVGLFNHFVAASFFQTWAAASPELINTCARAIIPSNLTYSRYDLVQRVVEVRWREAGGQRDVVLHLPYEPENGFRGCSPSAVAHLRLVDVVFQRVDRERDYQLQRAREEKRDLSKLSQRFPAVLSYGSLQENCAQYRRQPTGHHFGLDTTGRIVIADLGWDTRLQQDVVILLPFEPEAAFKGCSEDAKALLRLFINRK